jgi:hypothetical protein
MHVVDLIIGMNLSSSQIELVQSWGLGHSGQSWDQELFMDGFWRDQFL